MEQMKEQKHDIFTIPDKYRKVGNPYGQYILYIEDYVHTFMKQYLKWKQKEITVSAYGQICESDGHFYIFVTASSVSSADAQDLFPQQTYLGNIEISGKGKEKKDNTWKLKLLFLGDIETNLDSYYIFYEKNEAMQNYLIKWHEDHNQLLLQEEPEMAVKYARALQNCAHFEMKGNKQKQIFTIICFSFFIILTVMTITIMNNYRKMIELQNNMTYIMAHMDALSEDDLIQKVEDYMQGNESIATLNNQNSNDTSSIIIEETQEQNLLENETEESDILNKQQETELDSLSENQSESKQDDEYNNENQSEQNNDALDTNSIKENGETNMDDTKENETNIDNINQNNDISTNSKEENEANVETADAIKSEEQVTITYKVYTVKEGDSLRRIVWNQYHSLDNMSTVCSINQINNPDEILIGQKIYLP